MTHKEKSHGMKLFMLSILAVQLAAAWSMPQVAAAPSGHKEDDNGPVQVGYVVVTPPEGAEGITVFETFGRRHGGETQPAGVLPSAMTTHAVLFVNTSGRLSRNVGVAIANPDPNQERSAAITMRLYDDQGELIADYASTNDPLVVNPGEQIAKYVTELFENHPEVHRDFTGTLDLASVSPPGSSDSNPVPIAVIGIRARGENFSTLPVTSLSGPIEVPQISSGVGGAGAIILAHFAVGGGWATEIVIANTSDSPVEDIRVDLFNQDGDPLIAKLDAGPPRSTYVIPFVAAHGVATLAPRDEMGDSEF